jgi:hypothetical protein
MAASDEHIAISDTFIKVTSRLSDSRLYGFREADRSTYDFACNLVQTHDRTVIGQTLWGHPEGILKDVVSLQTDTDDSSLGVYLYPDTLRARRAIDEALQNVRKLRRGHLSAMRMIPIPTDFRADDSRNLEELEQYLEQRVSEDLLLRIMFGNASEEDILIFQHFANIPGMNLAILDAIHHGLSPEVSALSTALGTAKSTTTNKLNALIAGGLIDLEGLRAIGLSPKGRLIRDIASMLHASLSNESVINGELRLILSRFGMSVPQEIPDLRNMKGLEPHFNSFTSESLCIRLLAEAVHASEQFGSALTMPNYGATYVTPPQRRG